MQGEKTAIFTFDEALATLIKGSRGLGLDQGPVIENGTLEIQQVDPAERRAWTVCVPRTADGGPGSFAGVGDWQHEFFCAMPNEKVSCHAAAWIAVADAGHQLARVTEIAKQAWRFYREPSPPVLTEFAPVLGLFFAAFWHAPG
jgi:hypothetical protein